MSLGAFMGAFEETKIGMLPRAALTVDRRHRQPAIRSGIFTLLLRLARCVAV